MGLSMFGLFSTPAFIDPQFGEMKRIRGMWRAHVPMLEEPAIELIVAGPRGAPDPEALALARTVPALFERCKHMLAEQLFNHYLPYAEAIAQGELAAPPEPLPATSGQNEVWPFVRLQYVAVAPCPRELSVELGYEVAWDEEHVLGAFFKNGEFDWLSGSSGPP